MIQAERIALLVVWTAVLCVLSGCEGAAHGKSPERPPVGQMTRSVPSAATQPAANQRDGPPSGEDNPDITPPYGTWLQARHDDNEPQPLPGGPVRIHLSRQAGDVRIAMESAPYFPRPAAAQPGRAKSTFRSNVPPASAPADKIEPADPPAASNAPAFVMHNGRVRLRAVDATAADATTSQDTLDLEASWQDDQGNTFAVRCTRVIPGSFICPVYGGVATNRVLDGPPAPRPDCLPGGFAYLAFWGIGQTLENGQVLDSNIVIQGTLAEATPGQQNHPPLTDPLVAAGLRLHVLAGPAAVEQGRYMRRRIRTGCPAMNGQAVEYWHVTFDNLTVGTERTAPPVPKRTVRPSLAWRPTGPAQDVISTLTPSEGL